MQYATPRTVSARATPISARSGTGERYRDPCSRHRHPRLAGHGDGRTTIAEPPPRRTVSAAASNAPPPSGWIAVTAPISGVEPAATGCPPFPVRAGPSSGSLTIAGSASSTPLRDDSRGAAIATTRGRPRSRSARMVWLHRGDDRRAAGRTDGEVRPAVLERRSSGTSTTVAACPVPAGSGRVPPAGSTAGRRRSPSARC